jgi:arsenite methyltransferase
MAKKDEDIKKSVRERYGQIAKSSSKPQPRAQSCGCCSGASNDISTMIGYAPGELMEIPAGADLSLGCGNPIALASLKKGETVLDLGSGAGIDCFLAARKVGKSGRVIGVDMTHEMLEKARKNAEKGKYANVEFRLGEIEHLPVADNHVDVIISNCVINLVPDKKQVFDEAFRVLKPGGRLMVSDIVLLKKLPESVRKSVAAYTACVSGALMKDDYVRKIKNAGFERVEIIDESRYPLDLIEDDSLACDCIGELTVSKADLKRTADSIASIKVSGIKPRRGR